MVSNVYEICLPTHNTKIAVQCASGIAAIISYVSSGGNNIEFIWDLVIAAINASQNYGFNMPTASLEYKIHHAQSIVNNVGQIDTKKRLFQ